MKDIQRSNTCRYFVRIFANLFILLQKRHCSIPLQYWWNVAKPRIPTPINRHLQIDWNAFKWHTSITREQEVFSSSNKEEMAFETVWSFWMPFLYCMANQNKKITMFVIFSVFSFGYSGRILYLCIDFVTCWLSMLILHFATCMQHPMLTHW